MTTPKYKTIFTATGLSAIAASVAAGVPLNLTQMSVGDGAGNDTTPNSLQMQLVREVFRADISRLYPNPAQAGQYVAELVIPASAAGFAVREAGLFDADGTLIAIANTPTFYKPSAAEGAFSDVIVRLVFVLANASAVTLLLDPNVAVASQTWIANNVTFGKLMPGGTYHQVLRKKSNVDGDAEWAAPDTSSIIVDTIEEQQTTAAGQTTFDLLLCTTRGLALYADGVRLSSEIWTADPVEETRLTLDTALPTGTLLICVQNEPNAHAPAPLERSLNLADVDSAPAARDNLDVYSRLESNRLTPVGSVTMYAGRILPVGWAWCNGAALSRTTYGVLYAMLGNAYGAGDGFSTFNVPDMRAQFARGHDNGRGLDPLRVWGSSQDDSVKTHQHVFGADDQVATYGGYEAATASFQYDAKSQYGGSAQNLRTREDPLYPMATETRPRNVAFNFIIKW